MRALAVAHIFIAILLLPLTLLTSLAAPILVVGPIWAMVLGRRMWKRAPGVVSALRRTHVVFLGVDALLIWYGFWMLEAASESAARGGGLLGGIGLYPIGLGIILACFSLFTLAASWSLQPSTRGV